MAEAENEPFEDVSFVLTKFLVSSKLLSYHLDERCVQQIREELSSLAKSRPKEMLPNSLKLLHLLYHAEKTVLCKAEKLAYDIELQFKRQTESVFGRIKNLFHQPPEQIVPLDNFKAVIENSKNELLAKTYLHSDSVKDDQSIFQSSVSLLKSWWHKISPIHSKLNREEQVLLYNNLREILSAIHHLVVLCNECEHQTKALSR